MLVIALFEMVIRLETCHRSNCCFYGSLIPSQNQAWRQICPYTYMGEVSGLPCLPSVAVSPFSCTGPVPPDIHLTMYQMVSVINFGSKSVWWKSPVAPRIYYLQSFLLARSLKHPCLVEMGSLFLLVPVSGLAFQTEYELHVISLDNSCWL